MNSVVFITIISIWLFIPLGILKGLIVRFFAPINVSRAYVNGRDTLDTAYCSTAVTLNFLAVFYPSESPIYKKLKVRIIF